MVKIGKCLLALSACLALLAPLVAAQEKAEQPARSRPAWPKKPVFSFRLGSYFSDINGTIRIDGAERGTEIDLQNDLRLPKTATVLRLRTDIRIASWFGLDLEYYRVARSNTSVIDREIVAGDTVFPINETIATKQVASYLDFALKFYLIHRERLDLGLWAGANVHFMKLSLDADPSGRSLSRNPWFPVPAFGAHYSWTILPRLYLYGKAGFFTYKVTDPNTTKLASFRFDMTLDYYFWKFLGVGVTYEYVKNSLEQNRTRFTGALDNRVSGLQVYAVVGF